MDTKTRVLQHSSTTRYSIVDLRDAGTSKGNSIRVPIKDPNATQGFNMKYREYFSSQLQTFSQLKDPRDTKRNLRLDELVDGGYVHEVGSC